MGMYGEQESWAFPRVLKEKALQKGKVPGIGGYLRGAT